MGPSARVREAEIILPLVCQRIRVPGSRVSFSVGAFEGNDWSLKPFKNPEDIAENRQLAGRIAGAVRALGGERIFAPYPSTFNAEIVDPKELWKNFPLSQDVAMFRNNEKPADGSFLRQAGDAGVFSAGGCAIIVAVYRQQMIFAHAGRDCVLDRKLIETGGREHGRPRESVVYSIIDAFGLELPSELEQLHAWVFYSIKPEDFPHEFDHPKYKAWNDGAAEYLPKEFGAKAALVDATAVYPDVPQIIKAQFEQIYVREENIHLEHAYLADELPHTRKGSGRYLTAVVRHS